MNFLLNFLLRLRRPYSHPYLKLRDFGLAIIAILGGAMAYMMPSPGQGEGSVALTPVVHYVMFGFAGLMVLRIALKTVPCPTQKQMFAVSFSSGTILTVMSFFRLILGIDTFAVAITGIFVGGLLCAITVIFASATGNMPTCAYETSAQEGSKSE
jgi:uncharacterized membrane protein